MLPTVTIRANETIFDAEYCLPASRFVDSDRLPVVATCKLTLDRLGVAVLFGGNAITPFVEHETRLRERKYGWLDHLVNFIIYKSRVYYRGYCNWFAEEVSSFDTCSEVDRVITFNLERMAWKGIRKVGDRFVCLDSEPCRLEVERNEFDRFHKLIDRSLALAITYFLIACDNPRYFLVEYYKCVEVIKKEFGAATAMTRALRPHGFSNDMFKKLTKNANDDRMPITFGRHAPKKDADVFDVDLRTLQHPKTMQRELFIESTRLCRACIDAYVSYLGTRA
jgi:hypothetical protein